MSWQVVKWQDIESAPKDGREVMLLRLHNGKHVKAGWGYWGVLKAEAPSRLPLGIDPLGRLSKADYERERRASKDWVDEPKWLVPSGLYAFPTPTHWAPDVGKVK